MFFLVSFTPAISLAFLAVEKRRQRLLLGLVTTTLLLEGFARRKTVTLMDCM